MSQGRQGGTHFDVAISGCGPVGATLAGLLGRLGLRVGVFDRAAQIHPQPRAVGFDHDAMRLFQRIGVAEALAPHIARFRNSIYIGADGQVIQRVRHMAPPFPLTWAPNYTCDQPGVEAELRAAIARMDNVRVALGHELLEAAEEGDRVRLEVREPGGAIEQHTASYLVGCDGASSPLRRALGIDLESFDYDEPWIVVDMRVDEAHLARLPDTNVQYCEPERPCTHVVCPGNHRRWEFMLLPGEQTEGALSEERLWALLARWLRPGEATIWRAAAYRFHALIAREWRRGRIFLAGDSAHQTPPFLGQGMCQGLRDAGNLAWKLAAALSGELGGKASDALLDSYAEERRPHVAATTRLAKEIGRLVSERDPERARARDAALLAKGRGEAPTMIRQDMIPPLEGGWIARGAPRAGEVFPQPVVLDEQGRERLFDDVGEPGYRLVLADEVRERDGLLRDWFAQSGCIGALVRPDHYVFGAFANAEERQHLLEMLQSLEGTADEKRQARFVPARRAAHG